MCRPPTGLGVQCAEPRQQSDWIRLYLVSRYGGYWLDASVVLTKPPDWLEARQGAEHSEFVGFTWAATRTMPATP